MTDSVTVLVIEDNPLNLKLVRDLLEVFAFVVLEAGTARAGDLPRPREEAGHHPHGYPAPGHRRRPGARAL